MMKLIVACRDYANEPKTTHNVHSYFKKSALCRTVTCDSQSKTTNSDYFPLQNQPTPVTIFFHAATGGGGFMAKDEVTQTIKSGNAQKKKIAQY